MPVLDWIGKSAVVRHHEEAVCRRRLEPVPGLSAGAASRNLVVEGDSLHALKSLLPRFAGEVKCAYIDPPYNTGHAGWIYSDSVDSPAIRRWLAEVVGRDAAGMDRRDRWLCMMYPRLALLRQLLRDDGVAFVSIGELELATLDLLMAEIFGAANRVGILTWQRKKKGSHLDAHMRRVSEFVVCYARDRPSLPRLYGEAACPAKLQPLVKRTSRCRVLRFAPGVVATNLPDGQYDAGFRGREGTGLDFLAPFIVRAGVVTCALCVAGRFVWTQETLDAELALGSTVRLSSKFGLNCGRHDQARKIKAPISLLLASAGIGTNEDATAELAAIFGAEAGRIFPYPKPVSLVQYLIRAATHDDRDALVLDCFAGSGTTAHAVLLQNAADGGDRRFILVEMEPGIARRVTAERVRRACAGYARPDGQRVDGLHGGFQFCTLTPEPPPDAVGDAGGHEVARSRAAVHGPEAG